jgi:hypothetical protein
MSTPCGTCCGRGGNGMFGNLTCYKEREYFLKMIQSQIEAERITVVLNVCVPPKPYVGY